MNVRYLVSFLVLLATAEFASGETESKEIENRIAENLEVIRVTATRLDEDLNRVEGSVSVVDGKLIQRSQQLALDESLARVPGVFFQNRYNFSQDLRISIRGFGSRSNFGVRGIKILVDDVPETLADGQTQVDSIDLGLIDRVEVLRGTSSALYGNASGGVINITSERAGEVPFIETRLAAGGDGFYKHQIKTGGHNGKFDYLLSLSDLKIDGYRDHSEAENTQFNGKFHFRPDDSSELALIISTTDQPVSNDPGGITQAQADLDPTQARTRNVDFDAGESLDQQKLGFTYSRKSPTGGKLMIRNYYLRRNFANKLPFTGGGSVKFDRFFAGGGVSYSRPNTLAGNPNRLIIGFDYDRQEDDRRRFDNNLGVLGALTLDQVETISSIGIFVQDQLSIGDAIELALGLRYDRVDFDVNDHFLADGEDSGSRLLDQVSPSVGAVFAVTPHVTVYGNIATSFQTPTSTEFANADGTGGFNRSLDPERATTFEVGMRGRINAKQRYEFAVFEIKIKDELIPFEIPSNPGRDFFANVGETTRKGFEFSYVGEPLPGLLTTLTYTYSDFTFDRFVDDNGNDFAGNSTPGIPDQVLFAEIAYSHPAGYSASIDLLHTDDLFANNSNNATISGYLVANTRFGYDTTIGAFDLAVFAGINNLFNEDYAANVRINAFGSRFVEPGPERNVYGGVSIRYRFVAH